MQTAQDKFVTAFREGRKLKRVRGVYGRVVRTREPQPHRLAEYDPRKFVMVMGPSGLQHLLGKTGFEALIELGFTPKDIKGKLDSGMKYKLVVFERPQDLVLGTWNGLARCVTAHYPDLAADVIRAIPEMKKTPIARFEEQAGFDFIAVHANGDSDARFMTAERFRKSERTACDARRFLFNELHINELYSGVGRTKTHDGRFGVREYIMPNAIVAELPGCRIENLDVTL